MAVAIVKKPPESYGGQCRRCGAVFRYGLVDLERRYDMSGDSEWLPCPACSEWYRHPEQHEGSI